MFSEGTERSENLSAVLGGNMGDVGWIMPLQKAERYTCCFRARCGGDIAVETEIDNCDRCGD
jgi:hypothetical protein